MAGHKRASPKKIAEEELFAVQERFQKAFAASPDPMTISTWQEGLCLDCNDSFLQATGYQRNEVLGRTGVELRFWNEAKDRSNFLKLLEESGRIRDLPVNFLTKSGEMRTGLLSAEVIEVTGQRSILTVTKDLTEYRKLEQQLRLSQRMESIGRLAGGVAHDFNNLLTVISGSCQQLLGALEASDPRRLLVEEIQQAGDRAALLTRQLLAFGRRQVLAPRLMDLNEVVRNAETILRRLVGEDIDFVTVLSPELGWVQIDPGQIEQVVLNLAVNSRDAMPKGGKLTLETANVDLDQAYASAHPPLAAGSYVLLAVSDTGSGISPEIQAHIFEPFFTTKSAGQGTGLGLAMVYGIIKQSGGYIWVYSEVGQGTSFKVYLPRARRAGRPKSRENSVGLGPKASSGEEMVLVVEDEDAVRRLVGRTLAAGGYRYLEARNGEEALEVCAKSGERVHLLITDVVMPRIGGPELAKRLQVLYPELRTLYVSGYADQAVLHHGVLERGISFLQKPFTPDVLLRRMREVLNHPEKS